MGNSYKELRPLAFCLSDDAKTSSSYTQHPFWVCSLPIRLKEEIRRAIAFALNRNVQDTRLPVNVLNKAARLLIPDITSLLSNADLAGERPWLYASAVLGDSRAEPANARALRHILSAWIRTALPQKIPQQDREELILHLHEHELTWQYRLMDLTSWQVAENQTARPYLKDTPYNSFILLPEVVAARICANPFRWGPHLLTFRRSPRNPGRSGIECLSWPPLTTRGSQWPFSVLLTLTLQTIPFQPYPELHCDMGIRRWIGRPTGIPGRKQTSIYILDSVPWIEGVQHSHCFQVAPASWKTLPKEKQVPETSPYQFGWSDDLVALLNRLHPLRPFPDPQAIKDNPQSYFPLSGKDILQETVMAIVFRPSMEPPHKVGTGLTPRDRYELTEQLIHVLQPELQFTPGYQRLIGVQKYPNPFFPTTSSRKDVLDQKSQEYIQQIERRKMLGLVEKTMTFEIWRQSSEMEQALRQAISDLFGYPRDALPGFVWETPEVTLIVQSYPLGSWGSALSLTRGDRRPDHEQVRNAILERVEQIRTSKEIPLARGRTLALVELAGAEMFGEDDPKPAIKIGFGKRSRLVQCITPPTVGDDLEEDEDLREPLSERAKSAVRDLLRQCGILGRLPALSFPSLSRGNKELPFEVPDPLHYLAVWMIKQYSKSSPTHIATRLPVIVHMCSRSQSVEVLAPGFRDWIAYPEAAFALVNEQGRSVQRPEEFSHFLRETLTRCLPVLGDTLLFCDAHNLRSQWWEWLQNEQITTALPPFLERYPQLRIVRIRKGAQEIPEWYAHQGRDPYGFSEGVFAIGESGHVFGGVQEKPVTAKLSKEVSKVSSRLKKKQSGERGEEGPRPDSYAWNPSLVEMTIACARKQDALMSAVVANELRAHFAVQTRAATLFPLPLHLAAQLDEYVLPLSRGKMAYMARGEMVWENEDEEEHREG